MEDQTKKNIVLSILVGSVVVLAIFLVLCGNQKAKENEASILDLYNKDVKKIQYNIDGDIVDTYVDTKTGTIATEDEELKSTEVISKTIAYLGDYFADESVVSLKKVEEDQDLSLYKLEFQIGDKISQFYVTKNGEKIFMGDVLNMNKVEDREILGGFFERNVDVRLVDNKIPIYFFGASTCPHSMWQQEVINAVKAKFGNEIIVYKYIDSDQDEDYFFDYSDGSMPLVVIGDKYFRVGSGEKIGKAADINTISSMLCNLQNLNACK